MQAARCIDLLYDGGSCYMNIADVLAALSEDFTDAERMNLRDMLASVLNGDAPSRLN